MTLDFSRCRLVPVLQDDGTTTLMPPPPHVQAGVEWIIRQPYALNGNDMGGMKSATAVIAAIFLFEHNLIDRVIVVAPAPVRPAVWYNPEIGELALHLWDDVPSLVTEYHAKIRQWRRGPEAERTLRWIVTNYEWLRRKEKWQELLQYCGPRTLLLLDESSSVRNYDAAQTEACMRLRWATGKRESIAIGTPRCGYCWLLNGTPLAESPEDLFSQGNMMHPDIHGCKYITHFRNRYAVMEEVRGAGGRALTDPRGNTIKRVAKWTNLEDLQRRFAPYILRQDWRKAFPLPGVLPPQTLEIPLSAEEWRAYRDMRDDMVHWLQNGGVGVARHAAVKVLRLAQVTSGLLGGIEDDESEDAMGQEELFRSLGLTDDAVVDLPGSFLDGLKVQPSGVVALSEQRQHFEGARPAVVFVGRSKLDALLDLRERLLREDRNLKLLAWFKFVPELQRFLLEVRSCTDDPLGAVCGKAVLGGSKKSERETAMRLLHPKTAPPGPATVGGTYGSGGLGLNFTAFSTVVNCSHVYEDWKRRQADKRVDRPGQRKVVTQFDLVATGPKGQRTIDHVILEARRKKMDLNDWTTAAWVRALKET